jgi:hypothetical protein
MKPNASPTFADVLGDTVSLICCMAFYGPPVIFLVVPWLLLGLVLIGPFAVVLTLVVALVAAAALVAGIVAMLAMPFRMIHRRRAARAPVARPVPMVHVVPREAIA